MHRKSQLNNTTKYNEIKTQNSRNFQKKTNHQSRNTFFKPTPTQKDLFAYALIHDEQKVILGQNSIIETWKIFVDDSVHNPLAPTNIEEGLMKIQGVPAGQMAFARREPKQFTLPGGHACIRNNSFDSALLQLKQETGLVVTNDALLGIEGLSIKQTKGTIINNKLVGFKGQEICHDVTLTILHCNSSNREVENDKDNSYKYSILYIKVPPGNLENIEKTINTNIQNRWVCDQELGSVKAVNFNEAMLKLQTKCELTEEERDQWTNVAKSPVGPFMFKKCQRQLYAPRSDDRIMQQLGAPLTKKDWLIHGIENLQTAMNQHQINAALQLPKYHRAQP